MLNTIYAGNFECTLKCIDYFMLGFWEDVKTKNGFYAICFPVTFLASNSTFPPPFSFFPNRWGFPTGMGPVAASLACNSSSSSSSSSSSLVEEGTVLLSSAFAKRIPVKINHKHCKRRWESNKNVWLWFMYFRKWDRGCAALLFPKQNYNVLPPNFRHTCICERCIHSHD